LAVRPEKLTPPPPGSDSSLGNRIDAAIRETIYAGSVSTWIPETADGLELKVLSQSRIVERRRAGDAVTLAWSPEHTVPVAD